MAKNTTTTEPATLGKPTRRVLGVIVASPGLTRQQVAAAVAKQGVVCFGGRISNESATYAQLLNDGYVSAKDADDGTIYTATAKGVKAYEAAPVKKTKPAPKAAKPAAPAKPVKAKKPKADAILAASLPAKKKPTKVKLDPVPATEEKSLEELAAAAG